MSGLLQALHIESDTDTLLEIALQLPCEWSKSGVTHYAVREAADGSTTLSLGWHEKLRDSRPLPFPLRTARAIYEFARNWLKEAAVYGPSPDTDGSAERGWAVRDGDSDHDFYSVVTIKAVWIIYGK